MSDENMSEQDNAAEAPKPDPIDALADRFEKRLSQISGAVENLTRSHNTARSADAENRLRNQVAQLDDGQRRADAAVLQAETALAKALESDDTVAIARAHRTIAERVVERDKARARRQEFDRSVREAQRRAQEKKVEKPAEQQPDTKLSDENLRQWKSRHSSWYGVDTELTKAALDVHNQIARAGVIPVGSTQYFNAIDMQMAQKFPDRFNRSPDVGGGSSTRTAGQREQPAGGRIPASVIDGWERMGIDVRDPKVVERMLGHRRTLVDKGILPDRMVTDRVRA